MIQVLTGINSYTLGAALSQLRADFLREHGEFALETVDVADWDITKLLDTLSALPFLSAKRLVIMYGLAANKLAAERIQDLLGAVSDETDLVIVEPKIDKRSVLYKTLKKDTTLTEFAEPDPRDLPRWLANYAKVQGGVLGVSDAAYLVSRLGPHQQQLVAEVDKLLLYQPTITRQTIELLTEQAPLSNVFDLIEAAFAGNFKRAISLYEDQRAQNVEPLAIEALFVWQLHALALVKTAGDKSADTVAAEAGLSPYVARKSVNLSAKRSLNDIKQYVHELAALEYAIKTTSVNPDELMKNYILTLGQ